MFSSASSFLSLPFFNYLLILLLCFHLVNSSSTPTKIGKGYRLISIEQTPDGGIGGLLQVKQRNKIYGPDIPLLQLHVKHESQDRLRVHITDAEKQRWEVPYNLLPREQAPALKQTIGSSRKNLATVREYSGSELIFSYIADPFSFSVKRKSNGQTLFNSSSDRSDSFGVMVFKGKSNGKSYF